MGNLGKSSRLASVETERHFNVQYLIIPYVPGFHFLKSEQLQTKNFKYILQKPLKQCYRRDVGNENIKREKYFNKKFKTTKMK